MAGELRSYHPERLLMAFTCPAGLVDLRPGLTRGEHLTSTRDQPTFAREADAQGNAVRVRNYNDGGSFSLTYMRQSPTNSALSAIHVADKNSETNVGVGTLTIKDLNGNTLVVCSGAFIEDKPPLSAGTEQSTSTWVFQAAAIKDYIGEQYVITTN